MTHFNVPPVTGKEISYIQQAIDSHKICGDGQFTKIRMLFGFSIAPLYITFHLGLLSAITGVILAIYYLIEYFTGKADVSGWTTIVVLILILGGGILLSLGIIGRYLGQVYLTVNNVPKFIVKETINLKK